MNCLGSEQIIALALEDKDSADLTAERAHVGACAPCAARLEKVQERLARLETAMTWFDRDHEAQRERLLAALAVIKNDLPFRSARSLPQRLKEILTMPRTWIGSAAAAALLLVVFFFWGGAGTAPLLAQTAQALREVKSYQCRVTSTFRSPDGKKSETTTGKWYWAAPGSLRLETYQGDQLIDVELTLAGKPGLQIDYRARAFRRLEAAKGSVSRSPLLLMGKLAEFSGQADRQLDKRQVNGVAAPGLEIALAKIDPDVGNGTLRLWIDPKTKLPVRVEVAQEPAAIVCEDFQWNLPTDNWFTVQPPAGYQDKTLAPAAVEEITKDIITGFKTFAKYCGGRYPQSKMIYGDVTSEELNRSAGLPPRSPPKDKALDKVYFECMKAWRGFGQINELQRHDAGAIYHGKTVGPQDKSKVLFRWTLADGRFRVIYGDLRVEDVSAARLKELEAN